MLFRSNGQLYTPDGDPKLPQEAPANFIRIADVGGHPGLGRLQEAGGNKIDRCVIFAFTVPASAHYFIKQSFVSRDEGSLNGQINLKVLVNDREIGFEVVSQSKERQTFDRDLGKLKAGNTIYVAVGPDGTDEHDHFNLDFSIAATGLKHPPPAPK